MMRWDILYNPWVDLDRYRVGLVATYNKYGNKISHVNTVRRQNLLDTFSFELREYFDVSFCYSFYAN